MTLLEVAQPWLYTSIRMDTIFELCPKDMYFRKGPGTFTKKIYYLDYCKESSSLKSMIKHIALFVIGVHSGVRNEKALNSSVLRYKLSNRSMDSLDDGLTPPAPSKFE